jgi:hypothetical protein
MILRNLTVLFQTGSPVRLLRIGGNVASIQTLTHPIRLCDEIDLVGICSSLVDDTKVVLNARLQ